MDALEPEFILGIEQIDSEHQQLVDLVQQLKLSINPQGYVRRSLAPIVARLLVQTPAHFDSEERLMEDRGYPGLKEHRAKHQELDSQLRRFAAELLTDEAATARKIHSVVSGWLFEHILTDDLSFAEFELGRSAPRS